MAITTIDNFHVFRTFSERACLWPLVKHIKNKGKQGYKYSLFPHRWQLLCRLVIAGKSVNSALNQDQPKLGILVFPVPLKMLPDGNSFLNQVVQILRNFGSKTWQKQMDELNVYLQIWRKIQHRQCQWGVPWAFSIRKILLPVTLLTWAIPWESRSMTPIWDGVKPFFANLQMFSST